MARHRTLPLMASLLGLAAIAASGVGVQDDGDWELSEPAPEIALRPPRHPDAGGLDCAECHAAIVDEWAASAHGIAWIDEEYRAALKKKRRPKLCYGCHAPEPLLAGEIGRRVPAREQAREFGVSCASCHEGPSGEMLGPRGTPTDAHASAASPAMQGAGSNELCIACHATNIGPVIGVARDFEESGQADRGRSCVGCHMAVVETSFAEGSPVRTGRSHALQTPRDPAFLRRAFEVEWRRDGGRSRVVVRNRAGHRVPGLIGRTLTLRAKLRETDGTVLEEAELVIDATAYLPVDGTRELEFGAGGGASVLLEGVHEEPRADGPVAFLEEELLPTGE